ncbi:MAG TPA: CZB domain-containing protein [Sideroxyarcus sp.]|nr:CZB domain-containing protein [Sideroxyarcus sp.]
MDTVATFESVTNATTGLFGGRAEAHVEDRLSNMGIDLVAVAESHVLLFNRMRDYLHGEPLEEVWPDMVSFAESCELGQWMANQGRLSFGHLPSFARLREAHIEFHQGAASVLEKVRAGSWIAAEHMRKQEFSQSLRRVLIMVTELNEDIRNSSAS